MYRIKQEVRTFNLTSLNSLNFTGVNSKYKIDNDNNMIIIDNIIDN